MNWIERWWPAFKRRARPGGLANFLGLGRPEHKNCRCTLLPNVSIDGKPVGWVTEVSINGLPLGQGWPEPQALDPGKVTVSGTLVCYGLEAGDTCNRDGCDGVIQATNPDDPDGGCTCFLRPPCGHCLDTRPNCPSCGWAAEAP